MFVWFLPQHALSRVSPTLIPANDVISWLVIGRYDEEVDEVVTLVVEEQAGLQLLAQFWSIHAEVAPEHFP